MKSVNKNYLTLFAASLLLAFSQLTSSATTIYNYLVPVRSEITNQLYIVTNTPPVNLKLANTLKAAQKLIDRTTATNLTIDVQTLGGVFTGLSRSSLSNTFLPLLDTAASDYYTLMLASYSDLTNQLTTALPSGVKNAASNNLAQLNTTLTNAANTNLATAVKLLAKAAAKVKVSTTLVTKANAVLPGANKLTAKIGSTSYAVSGLLGSGHSTGVLGVYNSGTHILTITANKLANMTVKILTIDVGSVTEGTTTHSFSGSEAVGIYQIAGLSGNGASSSNSGTITVTMNSAKKVMTGTFNFNVAGTAGNMTVTGTFLVNYN